MSDHLVEVTWILQFLQQVGNRVLMPLILGGHTCFCWLRGLQFNLIPSLPRFPSLSYLLRPRIYRVILVGFYEWAPMVECKCSALSPFLPC